MLGKALAALIRRSLVPNVARQQPDVTIGEPDSPYMLRWYVLPRNRLFNIYLHRFLRSDDDRAQHSHPWASLSFIVEGAYTEHIGRATFVRQTGQLVFRRAKPYHRIELHAGPAWTLFFTGPRMREWYFNCPKGPVHWRDFTAVEGTVSKIGRGCE